MRKPASRVLTAIVSVILLLSIGFLFLAVVFVKNTGSHQVKIISQYLPNLQEQKMATKAPPVDEHTLIDTICWDEGNEHCKGDTWRKRIYSGTGWEVFDYKLGDPDSDGEVRYLYVRNVSGTIAKVGQLPKALTYVASIAEGDGTLTNYSPMVLGREGNSAFRIEAYLAQPIDIFDYRLPVMVKYLNPPNELL